MDRTEEANKNISAMNQYDILPHENNFPKPEHLCNHAAYGTAL